MEQCENAAALLESVREQEVQFEQLTRALEEERRRVGLPATSPSGLGRPLPYTQNGRLGDADIERLKLTDSYMNGTQYRMVDPAHGALDESYTPEDESLEAHSVFSEEGTTRRMENGMKKPISRPVLPSVTIDGGLSPGMGMYSATLDRGYRTTGVGDYPTATVPRNYHYGPVGGYDDYRGPPSEAYTSLSRGSHMDDRYRAVDGYRTLDSGYRAPSRQQLDPYAAQPQVTQRMRALGSALEMRYGPGHFGLEDEQRRMGYDDYLGPPPMHPGGYGTMPRLGPSSAGMDRRRLRSCEDTLDGAMEGVDPYTWSVPMTMDRGSMASLDSTLMKPPPSSWRQPELPEVIAMLNYRLDPVKTNAAAFLQHLTFKNDKVKSDVRRLKGIPALVSMLDHPSKEVHHSACGALKNISYGQDADNKIAIKNCDGVPALVRLLRKTHNQDLTDTITGTLWNLSSHDSVKMEIVDHALHALVDEVIVPHSGWERGGSSGVEESCKPRHLEWETALTNTAGCLRNVSSERREARRKLRECSGLVDSLMYIVQSQINRQEVDNKLVENCVCLLRNLSYHVHSEVPGCEQYAESLPVSQGPAQAHKGGCFGSRKGKAKKNGDDGGGNPIEIPKRTTPAKGYELLFQPEVVRIYTSLLKESKNPSVLEAAAGAIQNLCAGRWSYGRYIRGKMREEHGLPLLAELLNYNNDRVIRAMSGAMRNLATDNRNRELLGLHAVPHLVANLPGGQNQPGRALSEETVVSLLSTLAEVLGTNVESAKILREKQGIERLMLIIKDGKSSEREVRAARQVLQLVWAHKELRRPLEKDGWKKADFISPIPSSTTNGPSTRTNGTYEDSTVPLLDRGEKRDVIPLNDLGSEAYSTLDQRERRHTLDEPTDTLQRGVYGGRKGSLPLLDSYDEKLIVCITQTGPAPPYHCY
ncbi:catenin delta-1 isoform X2 [Nothobranchius furzeri]|uniref:Transcript variant X3 n=1 Tax=Nothobranchius furzeri TaxID=105023 RepID=A0A9D2YYN5_NOTFU|nr:catenin delta-1 isoform X2 [Nothobranchius furzeri]KAF7228258.1 transcript variant X3 [Nothobranchius furzeri]